MVDRRVARPDGRARATGDTRETADVVNIEAGGVLDASVGVIAIGVGYE